jgi:DNA-binding response OmpR family regulator
MPKSLDGKVLIVDDDRYVRNLLLEFFSLNGYEVIIASNGKEALDILKDESFTLLITDLNMPEMDGIELVVKVRDSDRLLPIIGISSEDKKSEFLRAGADYFLMKPFSIRHLKAIVYSIFKNNFIT